MKRIHVLGSSSKIYDPAWTYPEAESLEHFKPIGLWYGVYDPAMKGKTLSWMDWQSGETEEVFSFGSDWELGLLSPPVSLEVLPAPSKILLLDTKEAILAFCEKFEAKESERTFYMGKIIDWPKVREQCAGIEFHPYHRGRFCLEHLWYSTIDCSSGCIWDLSAIKVEPISEDDPFKY